MAASSSYPVNGSPLVRGDPIDIPVQIRVAGDAVDISGWTWRAQVRDTPDGEVIATFTVDVTDGPGGELVLHLDDDDSALLRSGETFDLEQLTPVHRTWWIGRLQVRKDVSRDV